MHRSTDHEEPESRLSGQADAPALLLPALLLMIIACTVFANAALNGFVLDDQSIIVNNPLIRSLSGIPVLFESDYWEPTSREGLYRPVTTTSYTLDYAVSGTAPLGYHVTNILLHAVNSVLVLLVLAGLTQHAGLAWTAALLFAVHPIHTEVVAGVAAGRPELLATMFFLLALSCHMRLRKASGWRSAGLQVAGTGAYLLAMLSKETAIVLPLVILLADIVFPRTEGAGQPVPGRSLRSRAFRIYAPYVGMACLYAFVRIQALNSGPWFPTPGLLDNPLVALPSLLRTASALLVALRYLGLLVWPTRLSYDYSYALLSPIESFSDPRLILVLGFLVVIGAGLWLSLRSSRPFFFAMAFYAITFALASNVAAPIGTLMGERLVYLPSVGFLLAVTLLLRWPVRKRPERDQRRWLLLVTLPLVIAFGWRSTVRSGDWVSEENLFLHDLAVSPGSAKVRTNAGTAYASLGRHEEALEQYAMAAEMGLTPLQYPQPYLGIVRSLYNLKRYGEAVALYRELVRSGVRSQQIEDVLDQLRRDWRAPPP